MNKPEQVIREGYKAIALGVLTLCAHHMWFDYQAYSHNVRSPNCCGYVPPSIIDRPITHLLVDWTEPEWKLNATRGEKWLVSEGKVNGKKEFFTVLEKKPMRSQ